MKREERKQCNPLGTTDGWLGSRREYNKNNQKTQWWKGYSNKGVANFEWKSNFNTKEMQ